MIRHLNYHMEVIPVCSCYTMLFWRRLEAVWTRQKFTVHSSAKTEIEAKYVIRCIEKDYKR